MGKVRAAVLLMLVCWPACSAAAAVIGNDHLFVEVDRATARVFVSSPQAGQLSLLFYDRPPSSYTLIYADDVVYEFGGDRGRFVKRPVAVGDSIETVWAAGALRVTQIVRFLRRRDTGVYDGVLVSYILLNESEGPVAAGVRVLFDTVLGERGLSHFGLPDGRTVAHRAIFSGREIPSYWLSRSEENPGLCLRGVLKGDVVDEPERVVFANYRALRERSSLYDPRGYIPSQYVHGPDGREGEPGFDHPPYSRNDSAVAVYSPLREIDAGASLRFSTLLGLCGAGEYDDDVEIVEMTGKRLPGLREEPPDVIPPEPDTPKPRTAAPDTGAKKLSAEDVERIRQRLQKIRISRGSLREINEVLGEINRFLAPRGKSVSRSDLLRIIDSLERVGE
jgi:hypothetical protein